MFLPLVLAEVRTAGSGAVRCLGMLVVGMQGRVVTCAVFGNLVRVL